MQRTTTCNDRPKTGRWVALRWRCDGRQVCPEQAVRRTLPVLKFGLDGQPAISVRRWVALQTVLGRAGKNPVSASAARPCGVVALVGARFEPHAAMVGASSGWPVSPGRRPACALIREDPPRAHVHPGACQECKNRRQRDRRTSERERLSGTPSTRGVRPCRLGRRPPPRPPNIRASPSKYRFFAGALCAGLVGH
jgi:hypothetical protein